MAYYVAHPFGTGRLWVRCSAIVLVPDVRCSALMPKARLWCSDKGRTIKGFIVCYVVWLGSMFYGMDLSSSARCDGLVPCCGQRWLSSSSIATPNRFKQIHFDFHVKRKAYLSYVQKWYNLVGKTALGLIIIYFFLGVGRRHWPATSVRPLFSIIHWWSLYR